MVSHGRYVVFQMAEVAIPRQMFQEISAADRGTTAAATTRASMKRLIVTRSSAIDRRNASQMPGKLARSDPRPSVRVTRGSG